MITPLQTSQEYPAMATRAVCPFAALTLLAALLSAAACTPAKPVIATDGPTYDGMVPVRDSGMKEAWVKPDINISSYQQLLLLPVEVQFRAVRPGAGNPAFASQERNFPVSPADRQRLVDTVTAAFRDALAQSRTLKLATEPGPGVLLVRTALLDIVSKVPPEGPGRTETFVDEFGAATLVLELQDSLSGESLARAVDRRAADPMDGVGGLGAGNLSRANPVTTWSEVRRLSQRWATLVTRRIDQLYNRGRMPGQSPR
ncbi:MAG: DUF3313 family protein [Gammaproteobacteria bacterium]|nr:DUF3313 family protein [Gammaproteobacteria bacterium]